MEIPARSLGAYYTPRPLASLLTEWALRSPDDTVLDPSCGEGVFLTEAVARLLDLGTHPRNLGKQIAGVDIDPRSLARANGALLSRHPALRWGRLLEADFFRWAEKERETGSFHAIVGNPPFIRNQGRSSMEKRFALQVAKRSGIELTGDASLWAPFIATSLLFLKPGGRLAMVIPREAFFVRYAKPLFRHLQSRFATTRMIALNGFHFSALEKVALLVCEGTGPGILVQEETASLDQPDLLRLPEKSARSWIWNRIPNRLQGSVDRALSSSHLVPLSKTSKILLGVVTGDRKFFVRKSNRTSSGKLIPESYLTHVVTKPRQLSGSLLRKKDVLSFSEPYLLSIPRNDPVKSSAVKELLREGEQKGTPLAYKCRTRRPWYSLQRMEDLPDGFLGYLVKRRLRCAANQAGAQSINNVHRIYFPKALQRRKFPFITSWLNAVTTVSAELSGRIYGGGVLKLEPGEVQNLRVPDPDRISRLPAQKIDAALRRGKEGEAWFLLDGEISRVLDLPVRVIREVREAADILRNIRLGIRSVSGAGG